MSYEVLLFADFFIIFYSRSLLGMSTIHRSFWGPVNDTVLFIRSLLIWRKKGSRKTLREDNIKIKKTHASHAKNTSAIHPSSDTSTHTRIHWQTLSHPSQSAIPTMWMFSLWEQLQWVSKTVNLGTWGRTPILHGTRTKTWTFRGLRGLHSSEMLQVLSSLSWSTSSFSYYCSSSKWERGSFRGIRVTKNHWEIIRLAAWHTEPASRSQPTHGAVDGGQTRSVCSLLALACFPLLASLSPSPSSSRCALHHTLVSLSTFLQRLLVN